MSSNLNKPSTTSPGERSSLSRGTSSPGATRTTRPPATPSTPNGVARTGPVRSGANGTPISARASVRKPATSSIVAAPRSAKDVAEEDARAETNNFIEDLKTQLQKTEEASTEYEKQVQMLQSRLNDALKEQGRLEERLHEEEERVEGLENDKRESLRQKRELEAIYEAERAAVIKDKDATHAREEELQAIIQRLKESLAQKESRPGMADDGRLSRTASSPSLEPGQFAPPSLQRSNSKNNSKLLLQKDKVIESLRLELAEAEIKLVQMENAGGGRLQELERQLLETRMTNARLMEDNESYQLLLSEKTLNGDFARNELLRRNSGLEPDRTPPREKPSSSLADELSEAVEDEPMEENERIKKLETEVNSLKDQNKALTLYINKIIERILKHQGGFETILSNTEDEAESGARRSMAPNKDKELPPPPKENTPPGPSLLQRASSVVRRPRPQSMMPTSQPSQAPYHNPTVNENPDTAPSIPLKRTQSNRMTIATNRRSNSDWNQAAAAVVGNMYRGGDNTPTSPGVASGRNSFFAFQRTPSGGIPPADIAEEQEPREARKAALDALTGGSGSGEKTEGNTPGIDTPSPPRSTTSRDREREREQHAIMAGNKPRPLKLVQEHAVDEQKAANRTSWLPAGWFGQN